MAPIGHSEAMPKAGVNGDCEPGRENENKKMAQLTVGRLGGLNVVSRAIIAPG
jgi:hypothetical protein